MSVVRFPIKLLTFDSIQGMFGTSFLILNRIVIVKRHYILFNFLRPSVYYMYHHVQHQKVCMLAKYCIYVFCMILAINTLSLFGEFLMVSLEFFIDIIVLAALWSTQPLTEVVPRIFPGK